MKHMCKFVAFCLFPFLVLTGEGLEIDNKEEITLCETPYDEVEEAIGRLALLTQPQLTYTYNPHVPPEIWLFLEPYFLPPNHPVKEKLDKIFHSKRATLSKESFEKEGFGKVKERQPTNIVIGKHPRLKGYIVKAYLDTQPPLIDWQNWVKRITGAQSIRECIKKHGYSEWFTAPRKWIYPLPEHPSPSSQPGYFRKNFILIVEDMNIVDHKKNLNYYKSKITTEILDAFYTILTEVGLIDSVYPDNVPFTRKDQLAFIDTEHHHLQPVKYGVLKNFLSESMQRYWQRLVDEGGSKKKQ